MTFRTMRDLAATAALFAEWSGGRSLEVAGEFAELLLRPLYLDFVYLNLRPGQDHGETLEVARAINQHATDARAREIGRTLARWLDGPGTNEVHSVTNPLGSGMVDVIVVPIGLDGKDGALVAGSRQAGFPGEDARLVLDFAAQQAGTALQYRRTEDARKQLLRERDELQSRLQRSESLLVETQQVAHVGSWTWDVARDLATWSDEQYRIFGLTPREMVITFDYVMSLIHTDDRQLLREAVNRSLQDHQPYNVCLRIVCPNGYARTVESRGRVAIDEEGNAVRLFGTTQDITERCDVDDALEASRRRFQAIFENSVDGILLLDDAGRYLEANPSVCQFLGYSREELMILTLWDLTPAVDQEKIPDVLGRFLSDGELNGEYTLLCKSGATREVEYRAVTNILPDVHLAVLRDITARKQGENALRQSEERIRLLLDSTADAILGSDLEGRCTFCNAACLRILGHAGGEDLIGKKIHSAIHHTRADGTTYREEDCRIIQAIRRGERVHVDDEVFWRANGTSFPAEVWSDPVRRGDERQIVGAVIRFFDITERRRVADERRILNAALENAVEGIARLDIHRRFLGVNRAYAGMHGYQPAELDGMDWRSTFHPQDLEKLNDAYDRVLGEGRAEFEALGVRKNHSIFWKDSVLVKALDARGQWVGHFCFTKDSTERKQAAESLRESAARLQVLSRRVVEIQEQERRHIARELHDEVGQVLSAISVNLQVVKVACDVATSPRIDDSIEMVDQATAQVRNLSLDLRPSMLDDLGLVPTVRWYADRQAQRAGFALRFAAQSSGASLPADLAIACFRVVQEAVTNVVRHASATRVWVELFQGDDEVNLAIRDDGAGFDLETARRAAVQGLSLGLSGIRERVELLGGRTEVRSRPAHGTSIRVWFPIASLLSAPGPKAGSTR